jgi:Arc/MetJ-type ribon-helix-helix transcriptional regulator
LRKIEKNDKSILSLENIKKRGSQMKTVSVNMPDNLAAQINDYVKAGFFSSEPDVILAAMAEFLRRNRVDMMERFAREDIEWAKKEATPK